jgi:hypothetical protein
MSAQGRFDSFTQGRPNGGSRRILPVPVGAGERPFTEPTAAARPWRREPLTLRANARHRARIGILGGEQQVHHAQPLRGAGAGPLLAGALLPVLPRGVLYGTAALLLAASAAACKAKHPRSTRAIALRPWPAILRTAPENEVRSGLSAGGKWIRTIGPPPEIVVDPSGSRRDHRAKYGWSFGET